MKKHVGRFSAQLARTVLASLVRPWGMAMPPRRRLFAWFG
jgi:hypothetical protein